MLLGNSDGTFQAAVNYPSGANIAGIAAGDVTGDKIPDLIVTHYFGATVALQKGNGDGTFQPEQQIATDTSLGSEYLQLIDLNHDGKLDLLMSSVFNNGAAVLMGNGDGTFQPFEAYATGGQPYFFAVADVNGDRNNDLAVVDSEGDYATILLGNGDGTFSPRKNLPLGSGLQANITSAALGDFDGDGKLDVAITENTQPVVAVMPGNGDGTFRQPLTETLTQVATLSTSSAADFNRDGHLDLLVSGTTLLPGKGDGTFGTPVTFNSDNQIRSFVVGDFNGDGYPDVVDVGNEFLESQPLQVFLGNGDGTFQPVRRSWNLTGIPDKSVVGDFNHDGKLDLALTVLSNSIAVLLGNGDGTFAAPVIYATDELPSGLSVADLNGDGKLDLIATGSKVDVFLGNGDGTFPTRVDYAVTGFPQQLATGDFDGDGKLDIAVTAYSPGMLEILFGNGDGTFQTPIVFADDAPGGPPVLARDLNGDRVDDLLTAGGSGSLFVSAPLATVSPSSLDFGAVTPGTTSNSRIITITNSGNSPLNVNGAAVASPFDIVGSVCSTALSRLQDCEIPIVFSPTALGTQNGQVVIQEDAFNSKPVVLVTGIGGTAMLTATPASIDFGGQDVNTSSAPKTITLTNTSSVPVGLSSITASGPFAETSQCGTVLAGSASCSISVVFTPPAIGSQNGSITITDDAEGGPQSISLAGSGEAPLSIGPQSGGSLSATVKSGQSATYNLALTAGPNFNGTVKLACSGAPANAGCSMSPSSFTFSAGGTQNFTVTVTTSQQAALDLRHRSDVQLAGLGFLSCAVLLAFIGQLRHSGLILRSLLFFVLLTTGLSIITGCGGSSSGGSQQPPSTAAGTYHITITATSGSATSTQSLTLIVQ
ncbi:MAG: FG-GAP-like repeat-containing protein [Acidobacteriaceae bacterium]